MAKSELRLEAIRLRQQGISVKEIAKKIGVAKSSASLWVREVILSVEQLERLTNNSIKGRVRGSLLGALSQKNARLKRLEEAKRKGEREFPILSDRELKIAGLCLYWSEGSKKSRCIAFCNSDPSMILFIIRWLEISYGVSRSQLKCSVGINEAHRDREEIVKNYWTKVTKIPLSNFTKTSFKKYPMRKIYENFNDHYGTLVIKMIKPGKIYPRVLGEIHGLTQALTSQITAT